MNLSNYLVVQAQDLHKVLGILIENRLDFQVEFYHEMVKVTVAGIQFEEELRRLAMLANV